MNIIEFLEKDHEGYRKELIGIRSGLGDSGLENRIDKLILRCESHEAVERRLFTALKSFTKERIRCEWVFGYKANHEQMWASLVRLHASLLDRYYASIQQAFFGFYALAERYMHLEQYSLF